MIESLGQLMIAAGHESPAQMRSDSIENPRVPLSKWAGFGAAESMAGVSISPETAMQISAVYRSIAIISDNLADTPLHTFRNLGDGRKERARDHYAYDLLTKRTNADLTARRWKKLMAAWLLGWGNSYSKLEISPNGRVTALYPIHPIKVQPRLDLHGYIVWSNTGPSWVPADYMLHLRGSETDDSGLGKSIITLARESLGVAAAQERFGASFYGQGATMSGFFEIPEQMDDESKENFYRYIAAEYTGSKNWRKMGILDGGTKFQPLQINPVDAQYLESRIFSVREIARWFGVPPHMLADLDGAKYGNLGDQEISFQRHTMRPYYGLFSSEINSTLFSVTEQKTVFVEFEQNAILQASPKEQAEVLSIGRQNGVLNANEWRALINLNPIDGPAGDAYLVNGNMVNTAAQIAAPNTNEPKVI